MPLEMDDPEWSAGYLSDAHSGETLVDILGALPIFETLTWKELAQLERIVHRRWFVAGEMVIQAWIPRSGLFVVITGNVHVVRHDSDGTPMILDTLGPGTLLGEFAILDDSPRSSSIVAAEPSHLIGFFRPDLMDLVNTDPRLGFKILHRLAQIMSVHMQRVLGNLRESRETLRSSKELQIGVG